MIFVIGSIKWHTISFRLISLAICWNSKKFSSVAQFVAITVIDHQDCLICLEWMFFCSQRFTVDYWYEKLIQIGKDKDRRLFFVAPAVNIVSVFVRSKVTPLSWILWQYCVCKKWEVFNTPVGNFSWVQVLLTLGLDEQLEASGLGHWLEV